MDKLKINKKIEKIIEIFVILFGLYLLIQVLRVLFGGLWTNEDLIIGLLIFNLGCIFTIGISVAQLKSDHNYLKSQFRSLVRDFKLRSK
jgi:ABC-type multidrug transport system permease subunit